MAAYSFTADVVDGINKTTTGTTVDSVVLSAGGDGRRQWTVEVSNWGSVDAWVTGRAYGSNTVTQLTDPTASGDSCHRVKAGTSYVFTSDLAAFFIVKILSTSGNLDYSVESIEERPQVMS